MRALLIEKTGVREVHIENSLQAIYEIIGCRLIDNAGSPNPYHAAYGDDEALLADLHGQQATRASWYPHTLAGKILVVGFDPETGESRDATLSVKELQSMVKVGHFVTEERP